MNQAKAPLRTVRTSFLLAIYVREIVLCKPIAIRTAVAIGKVTNIKSIFFLYGAIRPVGIAAISQLAHRSGSAEHCRYRPRKARCLRASIANARVTAIPGGIYGTSALTVS